MRHGVHPTAQEIHQRHQGRDIQVGIVTITRVEVRVHLPGPYRGSLHIIVEGQFVIVIR